ncbi:MAG: nucleotidyltransferase domain-containing protein, partial [Spirochaetaceae bacterium]
MAATRRFGYTWRMEPTTDQIAEFVQQVLNAAAPQTLFAVLFGSGARATMRPFSDIDIGLYFDHEPDLLTLGDIAGRIEAHAGRAVDIVML